MMSRSISDDRRVSQFNNFMNPIEKEDKEKGISVFSQFCLDNGIEHIVASKRRPTTIGKVERFHRTYDKEYHKYKSLRGFVYYYNFKRSHQSLGYLTPSEVYFTRV